MGNELVSRRSKHVASRLRLTNQSLEKRRPIVFKRGTQLLFGAGVDITTLSAGNFLRKANNILRCDFQREGAASFRLGTVSLIEDPMANRWKKAIIGGRIAEQQRVVRYHNICRLRKTTRTVNKARRSVEGTFATETIMTCSGHRTAGHHAIVHLQAVHIVVIGLINERQQGSQRRSLGVLRTLDVDHFDALFDEAVDFSQARVMGKTLQRGIRDIAKRLGKRRKLMIDQLVEQSVCLCRNADSDIVRLCHENRRNQIRHRLSNAGTRLNYEVLGCFERRTNFLSHRELLFTGLKIVIELSHDSRRGERLRNVLRCRILHRLNHLRIDTRLPLIRSHAFVTEFLKGKRLCFRLGKMLEHHCCVPLLHRCEKRDAFHQGRRHLMHSCEQDSKQRARSCNIVIRAVC